MTAPMSDGGKVERDLARHCIGLDGRRNISYRNYYVTGSHTPNHRIWMRLVEKGHTIRFDGANLQFGGDDMFKLTRVGAEAVLDTGERLDPEDFPLETTHA